MKIGMILDSAFPPDPRVENEALHLIRNNHRVFLFCLDYTHNQPVRETIRGIEVFRYRLPKFVYKLSALAYTTRHYHDQLTQPIIDFILHTRIDALHIHDVAIARTVIEISKKYDIRTVLDLHENRPEIMKYYPHVNSMTGKMLIKPSTWEKFESSYIRESDHVIVVTQEAKEYYRNKLHIEDSKFTVVPNTIRREFYTNYQTDKTIIHKYSKHFTLLYLGETGLRRGLLTAIQAIGLLKPRIPEIKLVIVGKSKTDQILRNKIDELHLENEVELAGWKDFSSFQSYIKACKIGISPIHRNIHHNTTYANKIFQYLAFGKPILVSDCLAQANVANNYNCGLVFKDQNITDFADKVYQLYTDMDLYLTLASNAIIAIDEHLRWEIQAGELTSLYRDIEYDEKISSFHGTRTVSARL